MSAPRIRASLASHRNTLFSFVQTCTRPQFLPSQTSPILSSLSRAFSSTPSIQSWLLPRAGANKKDRKGRPRVPTGGSTRGTTVVWGDYGLRLLDHDRRISAAQLKIGEDVIRKRLRGMKYRLYTRISANIGVYTSGNESRMGKGKGSFDYWASRVAVSKIIFELKGELHEQVVKDAFRLAGNKLPGLYEFVRAGDPPVMGITKLGNGVTEESLRRPRRELPPPSVDQSANRMPESPSP
ncbi:hypothetical protein KCU71_g17502, partial [Aureobasidium melanogenum]